MNQTEIVVGDIIKLEKELTIPADCILLHSENLHYKTKKSGFDKSKIIIVNEEIITGE